MGNKHPHPENANIQAYIQEGKAVKKIFYKVDLNITKLIKMVTIECF